jgi:TRAP-type C4-dicarboxylate transport system substrate-binding protein
MPWPDVPQALQTGVITGLDHTFIVCNITKKFTIAKIFTELDYAQGLFVHLINKRWFNKLPQDLQEILFAVITEESESSRALTRLQYDDQVSKAQKEGVEFIKLSGDDINQLKKMAELVLQDWSKKIGPEYLAKVRAGLGSYSIQRVFPNCKKEKVSIPSILLKLSLPRPGAIG